MICAFSLGGFVGDYFKRRLPLLFVLVFLLILGLVFGALSVQSLSPSQKEDLSGYLQSLFGAFTPSAQEQPVLLQLGMVDTLFRTTGLMWLLGFTLIGAPLIFALVFLRGFVIGFTVGFLLDSLLFKGLALTLALVVPHNLFVIPAVLVGALATLSFSFVVLKNLFFGSKENIYYHLCAGTLLTLLSFAILALASLVECYITPLFIHLVRDFL